MSQVSSTSTGDALISGRIPLTYPATNGFVLRLMTEERNRFTELINEMQTRIDNLSLEAYEDIVSTLNAHTANTTVHVTAQEKAQWNSIPSAATFTAHIASTSVHITAADRTNWDAKQGALTFDAVPTASSTHPVTSGGIKTYVDNVSSTLTSLISTSIAAAVAGMATTTYVTTQLAPYITSAAVTTLLESYATSASVTSALAGKVDVVAGKGLSTNDYTTEEKTKLAGVAAGAQVNTISSITVNGQTATPDANKNVEISISAAGMQHNLMQGGLFFMPNGLVNGVQTYRTLQIVFDNEIQALTLAPGAIVYVKNSQGAFVPQA